MGGRYGDGAIQPASIYDKNFKEKWHSRVLAVTLATGSLRQWNLDMSRHARECLPPKDYCAFSYYDKWISAKPENAVTTVVGRSTFDFWV